MAVQLFWVGKMQNPDDCSKRGEGERDLMDLLSGGVTEYLQVE